MSKNKKLRVNIGFVLDETGSMAVVRDTTVDGVNEFINGLRGDENAKYKLTLVKFNTGHTTVVHDGVKLKDVPELAHKDYDPRSTTPLYDTIASTIKQMEDTTNGKGNKVLLAVMTDGLENASLEWDRDRVFKLIKKKRKKGWEFAFLGANQDSYAEGAKVGIAAIGTMNYSSGDEKGALGTLSASTRKWTSTGAVAGTFELDDDEEKK